MTTKIRQCTLQDLPQLQEISIQTFYDTFAERNSAENMNAYLERSFHTQQLTKELNNPLSSFFFVYWQEQLAGYLKMNRNQAQSEPFDEDALEVERIYLKIPFQKIGLGKQFILHAQQFARDHRKQRIWLGVWESNANAIAFYTKLGFVQTSEHSFYMGDERQRDLIMTKDLPKEW